jgi:hypothetical protein
MLQVMGTGSCHDTCMHMGTCRLRPMGHATLMQCSKTRRRTGLPTLAEQYMLHSTAPGSTTHGAIARHRLDTHWSHALTYTYTQTERTQERHLHNGQAQPQPALGWEQGECCKPGAPICIYQLCRSAVKGHPKDWSKDHCNELSKHEAAGTSSHVRCTQHRTT